MQKFGLFLVPGFSLVALSCVIDVLRAANVAVKKSEFSWTLLGDNCTRVTSSSGLELPCEPINNNDKYDVITVCGGERSHMFHSKNVDNWLHLRARTNIKIGSISDGAYVVAQAGLFDKCRSTIHWKCQNAYREIYPNLDIKMSILEMDGNRFSCAGGTSSLDLMLGFVSLKLGKEVAGQIADNYFHDNIRGDGEVQHTTGALRFALRNKTLSDALSLMEAALENPITIESLTQELGVSLRQLDRLFQTHLKTSPSKHYRDMRLFRASGLLKQTSLSVSEIASGCGFQSASHFSKYFKQRYQQTPRKYRYGG
jgi:transcriptional regulator GlxA family with amidase domain